MRPHAAICSDTQPHAPPRSHSETAIVSYHDLAHTDLAPLDSVATDLERMTRTWEYASDFRTGVVTPLQASGWSGQAADAAASRLDAARAQMDEAFDETSALAKALRDAHDQLAQCKRTLQQIQQDAHGQGLTISADGGTITWSPPSEAPQHAEGRVKHQQTMRHRADAIAARITSVLRQATETDKAAAAALAGDTGTSLTRFHARPVGGVSEQEAHQAADLARKGSDLTDAQLERLDALLKEHATDPRFATAFYDGLGPQQTLTFWGRLTLTNVPGEQRHAVLTDLQRQLGASLACATDTRHRPHLSDAWEADLRRTGAQKIRLTDDPSPKRYDPYGYQILDGLLRTGSYDPHFLDPIAEHITQLTENDPRMWIDNAPMVPGTDLRTNFLGNGSGFNPQTGVLEALGHSPAAATHFFHDPETLYTADGTPTGHTAPNGYLGFLTDTDRNPQFADTSMTDVADRANVTTEPTALGHALEAATTGAPYDAQNGTPLPPHTAAEADVMSQVVKTFGDDPTLIQGDDAPFAPMTTSLAHMTAQYMGDVQRSLVGSPAEAYFLSTHGVPAKLDGPATEQLLETLGRDPGAYGILTQAQHAYTAAQIHNVAVQHPTADFAQMTEQLRIPASAGAYAAGFLNSGKANEIMSQHLQSDAAWNAAVEKNTAYVSTVWGLTGGKYLDEVPVVGGFANDHVNGLIEQIAAGYQQDTTNQAVLDIRTVNGGALRATANTASFAVRDALRGSGFHGSQVSAIAGAVSEASRMSFGSGEGVDVADHGGWAGS
jgi:hypothetical protein